MTDHRSYHKYGECKTGTNNKYYQVEAQELEDGRATWSFTWARIGYECSKPKEGVSYSFERAEQICRDQWKKKSGKYKEVNAMQALASAAEEIHERPVNGYERVTLNVPCFHAGKSEERMKHFCLKYQDKLNVIRASARSMESKQYHDQVEEILKAYCSEFQRTKKTATHGPNLGAHADTAFRIFLDTLMANAECGVYFYHDAVGYVN
jgi:hypothetical protein